MAQSQILRSQSASGPYQSYPMATSSYNPNAMTSFDAPVGYPGSVVGMPKYPSINQQNLSGNLRASTTGAQSNYRGNLVRQSRSLGASKASLASEKGGKTSIRREYQDKKLRTNLKSPNYGKGRVPFIISIALFVLGFILIISGVTVLLLRFHNNIFLSIDKGEIIGPLLITLGIAAIAGGVKFYYDAYIISNRERAKIKFTPANESLIRATTAGSRVLKAPPGEMLMSGTISANAVSRTPHGSMGSLNNI